MRISKLDTHRVLVVLADRDMCDFELDFDKLSMENDHTRRILLRLTRLACRKTGIDFRGKRMSVEALMMGEGCYLLVTVKAHGHRYTLRRGAGVCYRFGDVSAFLDAVEAAYRLPYRMAKTAACEWDGAYFLLFEYPAVPKPVHRVLSEFAERRGSGLKCVMVREHGRLLCPQNAVATIGKSLI